ncbi:MAG: MoxR family ATPase [Lachnospiraceae bacterium]|nr:MoxR family ATPase [Lachnospiraceae bacterium]
MNGYEAAKLVMDEVNKVIIGKPEVVKQVMMSIIAGGHVLIEDIPGVGKTTLATAFSKVLSLKYNRMQFTPDVMPSDITGFSVYNKEKGTFEYKEGVIMCNLFLADEINRTSSKTQSALLEAMEEGKVTVDGVTRNLEKPFVVIATQNPIGSVGTTLLPESQLDRFMFKISIGYPSRENEILVLRDKDKQKSVEDINAIISSEELVNICEEVQKVFVHDYVLRYIVDIAEATRKNDMVRLGISPRGTIAVLKAAKAAAYLDGRDFVTPEDVREVIVPVANHRILVSARGKMEQLTEEDIIGEIIRRIQVRRQE